MPRLSRILAALVFTFASLRDDPQDLAVDGGVEAVELDDGEQHVPEAVAAGAEDPVVLFGDHAEELDVGAVPLEGVDAAGAVVAVEVGAVPLGHLAAPVDGAAGDRATLAVVVLGDRGGHALIVDLVDALAVVAAAVEAVVALH